MLGLGILGFGMLGLAYWVGILGGILGWHVGVGHVGVGHVGGWQCLFYDSKKSYWIKYLFDGVFFYSFFDGVFLP